MAEDGWGAAHDCVYLVLLSDGFNKTGLKIPLDEMRNFFRRPLKGLRAMAYAILGTPGDLRLETEGTALSDAQLESIEPEMGGKVYRYVMQSGACSVVLCARTTHSTCSYYHSLLRRHSPEAGR
jgi:hypothetical protein